MVGILENQKPGALPDHEAVTVRVERAARGLGRGVLSRQDAEQAEQLHLERRHDALGAAGQRHVDRPPADRAARLTDRLSGGGARGLDRHRRSLDAEVRGEPGGEVLGPHPVKPAPRRATRELVDEPRARHGPARRTARVRNVAEIAQVVPLAARADEDARARRGERLAGAGRGDGAPRGAHAHDHPARLQRIERRLGPELLDEHGVVERGGDLRRESLGIEVGDAPDSRDTRERGLPEPVELDADRGHHVEPGHDHAPARGELTRGASSHRPPSGPVPGSPAPPGSPGRTPRRRPPRP